MLFREDSLLSVRYRQARATDAPLLVTGSMGGSKPGMMEGVKVAKDGRGFRAPTGMDPNCP